MLNFFLPYVCVLCRQWSDMSSNICRHCLELLPILQHSDLQCANQSAIFDSTCTLFLYQPPITKLIYQLKFNGALANAKLFGDLLVNKIQQAYHDRPMPQLIIPVPLHPKRLKERGFNQALEIARPVAKKFKIPIDLTPQRCKYTMPQATLLAKDRLSNVKNAFIVNKNYHGMSVAILDDVITTGHTVQVLRDELKNAGVERIDIWCCARPQFK